MHELTTDPAGFAAACIFLAAACFSPGLSVVRLHCMQMHHHCASPHAACVLSHLIARPVAARRHQDLQATPKHSSCICMPLPPAPPNACHLAGIGQILDMPRSSLSISTYENHVPSGISRHAQILHCKFPCRLD